MKISYSLLPICFFLFVLISLDSQAQNTGLSLSRVDSVEVEKCFVRIAEHHKNNSLKEEARNYNQIAHIYWNHNQFQNAIENYLKSIELNKLLGNQHGIATISNHLGLIYSDMKQYSKSLEYFEEALRYRRTVTDDKTELSSSLISISVVYKNLKQYQKGIEVLQEATKVAKETSNPVRLQTCYGSLSEMYELADDTKQSVYYFKLYRAINELIHNKTKDKVDAAKARTAIAEAEKLKKQLELIKKQSELEKSTAKNKNLNANLTKAEMQLKLSEQETAISNLKAEKEEERRYRTIWLFSSGILFLLVLAFILIKANKHKKEANKKLSIQNAEILAQREEITKQRDNINLAKIEIEKQNTNIKKSINYANLIQTAMLNKTANLQDFFPNSFILFEPRDIVSGDFYWYGKVGGKIITAAADCTGHGVPGAFLSMIGNQLLNLIVTAEKETDPAQILYKIEAGIRTSLNQEHTKNSDGMDVAICVFDFDKMTLQYAGAKNPLVIVKDNKATIFKGDKFSIGGFFRNKTEKVFTAKETKIVPGSIIYTFSDGLADQLGGEKRPLKYSTKRLIKDLENISKLPIDKQRDQLMNNYNLWRGKRKRIDDLLLIGIKI